MIHQTDNAFPSQPIDNPALHGLTKREYFAAMAMQGILADTADRGDDYIATRAVNIADALINALNKKP